MDSTLFAVVPNAQLIRTTIGSRMFMWSTKVFVTARDEDWALKTKKLGLHAAELNRGVLLSNDITELEQLAMKYGGVVQCIRTGEIMSLCRNGWAFETWTATSKPFIFDDITLLTGHVVIGDIAVRNEFRSNGQTTMNYIRHITDAPEVISLLGKHHYIP